MAWWPLQEGAPLMEAISCRWRCHYEAKGRAPADDRKENLACHRRRPWHGRRYREGDFGRGRCRGRHGSGHQSGREGRGQSDWLVVKLDVTRLADAEAASRAAVDRFGRIDILVNNAGNFFAGFFEELSPEDIEKQLAANLIGPMNVTRAVLPVMRKQRSGHIITISSSAGLVGFEFCSAYAAAKFGVEGWPESLQPEIALFAIHTPLVTPGFFRTQLISDKSMTFGSLSIPDYEERRKQQQTWWMSQSGQQAGDPAKLAEGLVQIARQSPPPRRWVAGADAVKTAEQKAKDLLAQARAFRELSSSLAYDDPTLETVRRRTRK